jgi:hypothetical protein
MFRLSLPQEKITPSSWRRLGIEISGSLLLLLCINLALIFYLGNLTTNYGYWTIHQKWWLLEDLQQPVDWLILGDSSCNQGVMPEIFENELGETAVNLCTIGNLGTVNDLWMLEEYIDRFGPPLHVVIIHVFDIWHRPLDQVIIGQVPRAWGFWDQHTLGMSLFEDEKIRQETFLERYLPLYSQSRTITNILRTTVMLQHNPFKPAWRLEPDGFLVATEPHVDVVLAGAQDQIKFAAENFFSISPTNDMAMQEIGVIADSYGFEVYLVNSPVYQGLNDDPAYQTYLAGVQQKLAEFASDSAYVFHISAVRTFPAESMQNPDHLILTGAVEYTHWLIEQIDDLHRH